MISLLLPLMLLGAGPVAPVDRVLPSDAVLRSLEEGEAARAAGDYTALLRAAQALEALGAAPAEGQADLATQWTLEARAQGVATSRLAFRGRALGPAYRRGFLAGGGTVTVRQLFLAGQRAQISVAQSDRAGSSDRLSIRVRDGAGGTLCDKRVGPPQVDCAWLPLFTDRYAIEIANGGNRPAAFYLIVR